MKTSMRKVGLGIVTFFLAFLPFQKYLLDNLKLPHRFLWVDEIFIVWAAIFYGWVWLFRWKNKSRTFLHGIRPRRKDLFDTHSSPQQAAGYSGKVRDKEGVNQILWSLFILCGVGIISGFWNKNHLMVTSFGTFDYIKNFLPIIIFPLFELSEEEIKGLYKILFRLAVFLCLVALLEEIFYLAGFPIPGKIRFGFLRTSSLVGHPNILGLYALLFFILDFSLFRRLRWQNLLLTGGIFLSVSRMVWSAFFLITIIYLIQEKNKSALCFFIIALLMMGISVSPFSEKVEKMEKDFLVKTVKEIKTEDKFRGYALRKSLEIWQDNFLLGVGPGMYGGVISVVFTSPVYKKYRFSQHWFDFGLKEFRSLDQFWPQCLAEIGLVGALAFGFLLFNLWRVAKKASLKAKNFFQEKMLLGFSFFPLVIILYLLGSGLNLTAILLTYSILLGLVLGINEVWRGEDSFN